MRSVTLLGLMERIQGGGAPGDFHTLAMPKFGNELLRRSERGFAALPMIEDEGPAYKDCVKGKMVRYVTAVRYRGWKYIFLNDGKTADF